MTTNKSVDHGRHARWLLPFAAILAVSGCATIRRSEAGHTEQLLAAAGFQMRAAETPEQIADLSSAPARKLLARTKDGSVVYTYADPDKCHCVYVGGPKEYSAYERIKVEQEVAADRAESAMDWPWWGPWGW